MKCPAMAASGPPRSTGAGAGSRQAIGITTFWGMLVATIVGMMFIPGLYAAFQRIAEFTVRLFGKKPKEELKQS